jgi:HEAT repeat protein
MINPAFTKSIDRAQQDRIKALFAKYPALLENDISIDATRLKTLLAELDSKDTQQACEVAFALGDSQDVRCIVPLAKMYYEHRWHENATIEFVYPHTVRAALAIAIYNLGEYKELEDVLFSESGYMRPWMVTALRQLDNEHVVNCLIRALSDQGGALVYWAARALGAYGDVRGVEPMIETLSHPYVDARVAAADSLGLLGDQRAVAALEHMQQDDDHEKNWRGRKASQAAADAIKKIQGGAN